MHGNHDLGWWYLHIFVWLNNMFCHPPGGVDIPILESKFTDNLSLKNSCVGLQRGCESWFSVRRLFRHLFKHRRKRRRAVMAAAAVAAVVVWCVAPPPRPPSPPPPHACDSVCACRSEMVLCGYTAKKSAIVGYMA